MTLQLEAVQRADAERRPQQPSQQWPVQQAHPGPGSDAGEWQRPDRYQQALPQTSVNLMLATKCWNLPPLDVASMHMSCSTVCSSQLPCLRRAPAPLIHGCNFAWQVVEGVRW